MSHWAAIEYFSPEEFDRPEKLNPELLYKADSLRRIYGNPLYVKSDYRPRDRRAHGDGDALDLGVAPGSAPITGRERWLFVQAALQAGFTRIGLYDRHFHVDVSRRRDLPREVIWLGKSR